MLGKTLVPGIWEQFYFYVITGCEIPVCQVPDGRPNWGTGTPKIIGIAKQKKNGPNLCSFTACNFFKYIFSLPFYCVSLRIRTGP